MAYRYDKRFGLMRAVFLYECCHVTSDIRRKEAGYQPMAEAARSNQFR
ncbi:MAG TPA: hypothetical protein VFI27_21775 [candidate division Zixibacteria bacterium]|nr:hypothetical protein [candidate division Zixibacteria bacterium]